FEFLARLLLSLTIIETRESDRDVRLEGAERLINLDNRLGRMLLIRRYLKVFVSWRTHPKEHVLHAAVGADDPGRIGVGPFQAILFIFIVIRDGDVSRRRRHAIESNLALDRGETRRFHGGLGTRRRRRAAFGLIALSPFL